MELVELLVILFLIAWGIGLARRLKDYINRKKDEQEWVIEHKKYIEREKQQKRIAEEIINSEEFKKKLKFFYDISRCFNLAGGLDPFLPSHFKYGDAKYEIIIEKQGYDLRTANLNEYYNNPAPQCYEALNRFAVDLFGEYADEMKNFISMEYIADHLIELEKTDAYSTDFILRYTLVATYNPKWNYTGDVRDLYIQEFIKLNTRK